MKQTLLTRLVLGAIAGIAAAGVAQAGQITASSTNVAREVITTDTQVINAPSISYRFAGDINATVQAQEFQIQFTLEDGANWAGLPSDNAITITPTAGTDAGTVGVGGTDFTVLAKNFDNALNPTVLFVTIRVPVVPAGAWTDSLLDQPIITLNAAGATTPARITKLKTLVGDLVADFAASQKCIDNKSLSVNVKHYKLLSNPTAIAGAGNGVADEHERSGSTNRAGIVNFPTNLKVNVATSTGGAVLTPGGNTTFQNNGTAASVGTDNSWTGSATIANIGKVSLSQNASGYDSNLVNVYTLNQLETAGTASEIDGDVENEALKIVVSATNGFVVGGNVYAKINDATCAAAGALGTVAVTALNAAGPITVTVPKASLTNANLGAAGTNPIQVCYQVPGNVTIPSSAFSAVATLEKQALGTVDTNEQNNVCNGNLYSLGGGIKIDVRNYASSKETSGWQSVIRFINNSDVRTADVWAQIIHQDGKFGAWGKVTDLAPRAVLNLTAAQIEALLVNAPNNATAANNGANAAAAASTGAPRLRVTSNSGSTLRVQNYLFNAATGQIHESSGSQGVDFDITAGRTPFTSPTQSDGQVISQDAQSGLNGR